MNAGVGTSGLAFRLVLGAFSNGLLDRVAARLAHTGHGLGPIGRRSVARMCVLWEARPPTWIVCLSMPVIGCVWWPSTQSMSIAAPPRAQHLHQALRGKCNMSQYFACCLSSKSILRELREDPDDCEHLLGEEQSSEPVFSTPMHSEMSLNGH